MFGVRHIAVLFLCNIEEGDKVGCLFGFWHGLLQYQTSFAMLLMIMSCFTHLIIQLAILYVIYWC